MKQFLGLNVDIQNIPELDPGFLPLSKFYTAFKESVGENGVPLTLAIERESKQCSVFNMKIHGTEEMREADLTMVERLIKTVLWCRGGFRIFVSGPEYVGEYIKDQYREGGKRGFDAHDMAKVYEAKEMEVILCKPEEIPAEHSVSKDIGRHLNGCRIGFDAGGSDRKVSAVIDGEAIWSEEVVWNPKLNSDPEYHYQGIVAAFRSAAEKMPRVDAIGISSAGIYVNNRTMSASLFIKVPQDAFEARVKNIYLDAAKEIGDVPVVVANDGDVTALAGAMSLKDNGVLGIAMGTSEAGGFVDADGNITGWLNELAFAPIDLNPDAMEDEWSGDIGCGVKYFSQDSVVKLAPAAGIELNADDTPAQKLKAVQKLMEADDERAAAIYRSIGVYLGHALAWYAEFYDIRHVLLLGRVMSGKGGDLILEYANKVLDAEYADLAAKMKLSLPDETFRRVGQSVAAASLPELN